MSSQTQRTWLVTGAAGLLGTTLVPTLRDAGHAVVALTRDDLDITDPEVVSAAIDQHRPDVVVNGAAYTAVDDAETNETDALRINGAGAGVLATACAAQADPPVLIHLSTDYVFDGNGTSPYAEDAATAPRTAYGRTKLVGEEQVRTVLPAHGFVVRTAWLYGPGGANFVSTMLRLEAEKALLPDGENHVDVVDDQRGQPTSTLALSRQLLALGERAVAGQAPAGIYHATASGETTWFGLTREIYRLIGADPERVRPTTSAAYVRPAPRPAYSVLGHDGWARAGLAPMPSWQSGLAETLPLLRDA